MPSFCARCFQGTLRGDITPMGTEETIHGLDVYVARPDDGRKPIGLVVIISDVFGWNTPNIRGLADSYARRGPFVVYVPDIVEGMPCNPDFFGWMDGIKAPAPDWYTLLVMKPLWIWRILADFVPFGWRCRNGIAQPRIFNFFGAIRQSPSPPEFDPGKPVSVGAVGFCWGGKYAVMLAKDAPSSRVGAHGGGSLVPLVDCAFTAHPSLLSIPSDVTDVGMPLAVGTGDGDEWMGAESTKTMTRVLEAQGGKHEVEIYPGAMHGFALRGDPKDPKQTEFALQAEDQAVKWFHKHFSY
ncbi:Alpha/Beta hydrolase protein [Zalerion maritima]|uniref:Alpha/Beta hydrolase protein n=1 Tax=Zalerion maritima TaxID=339359 RepID=A0AAD5RNF7_9PEZI|nr:Alpha/Beta hydrolase protein [Zalerion maritima]